MIYVSSSCVSSDTIGEAVRTLAEAGFRNIELSGGTNWYPDIEKELDELQVQYGLIYQLHNYFPPPEKHFVLNLASFDDEIYEQSFEFCRNSLRWSKRLGGSRYGIHAGYLIDFSPDEAGRKIGKRAGSDKTKGINRFKTAWQNLSDFAATYGISLYMENNVLSQTNALTFGNINPFLMTDYGGYLELREQFQFKVLFDVAHFKVSANSLGQDFYQETGNFLSITDYVHLSDNDGLHDQNNPLFENSSLFAALERYSFNEKVLTLEIYDDVKAVLASEKVAQKLFS